MDKEVIQKLTKKLTEGVKVDIPVVSPTQEVTGEMVIFLRKYSTNGTIPLAVSASFVTFTLSYFIGIALINTKTGNQGIYGYIVTASILFSLLALSLILNSWYRTIAKNEKTGNELLNSDLNKDGKGKIDKIKIILNFGAGRTLEYVVPVTLSKIDELRQQIRENRYRILLLSIPTTVPAITLLAMLVANKFNIKNPYIGIPVLISFFSIFLVKLGFTLYKAKQNKIGDYAFPQFNNNNILFSFKNKSSKITVISEQFKKQDVYEEENKPEVKSVEKACQTDKDSNEREYESPITRSNSSDTMYSTDNVNIKQTLLITEDRQEEPRSWFGGIGAKAGEALGGKIVQPIEKAMDTLGQTCKNISKAAQKIEQMGENVSELKESIKQMTEEVSIAARQLKQTSKDVSETAEQVKQTSTDISRFIRKLGSYLPNENDNIHLKMPLEDILPILKFKLKAKNDSGSLEDSIDNLIDGKVIVTYKKGSTLEFAVSAKNTNEREHISSFTELRVEELNMTVNKNDFNLKINI